MFSALLVSVAALGVGRSDIPNRFPVDVNNAITVELLAAGFNLPQALGIVVARETTGPFTGWKDLAQELRRHGLLDCGPYCARAIEKARPYVVFSGPTRMPVGAGVELVARAREEWKERGAQVGSVFKPLSNWLYDDRRFLGRVNLRDASTAELLVTGISLVEVELARAIVASAKKPVLHFGEIDARIQELENTAPCGRTCRNAFERLRALKIVTLSSMTTLVHPDPARETHEATERFNAKLKKLSASERAELETLQRFARAHGFLLPSLARLDAPADAGSSQGSVSEDPDRATLKR